MKNGEQPAFSYTDGSKFAYDGLTKREYFAGLAMQGMYSNELYVKTTAGDASKPMTKSIAADAVMAADALLAELEKPQQ